MSSFAGQLLVTKGKAVTVYSGPSFAFRPLTILENKIKVPLSNKIDTSVDGDFYRILVEVQGERKLGFVSVGENVEIEKVEQEEKWEDYKSLALARSALQFSFNALKNSKVYWSLGYLKYPTPSFYFKIFGGQLLSETASNVIAGGELGTDHLFSTHYSVYTSFASGGVFAPEDDAVFDGSRSFSFFVQGGTGLRYNAYLANASLGLTQMAIFNGNNSFLSWGFVVNVEVGL